MTRFSGIHLLALGVAVWGFAVWRLHTPPTTATVDTAPTQSEVAPAEQAQGSGTDAGREAVVEAQNTDDSAAHSTPVADTEPETTVAAMTPPPDPAPPAPAAPVPPPQYSELPATGEAGSGESPFAREPTWAVPRQPDAAGNRGAPAHGDVPRAPVYPRNPYEYPPAYSMRPARPGGGVSIRGNVMANEFNSARRAAWEGRLADAVDHYRAAARIRPGNYEVWGEMGNVLWQMGRWSEAAYALEGAASLLVQAGELQTASGLVPAVGSLDPEAARRIQERVRTALQRYPG